jgi:hypothetical protein
MKKVIVVLAIVLFVFSVSVFAEEAVSERGQRMVGKDVPERGQRMVGKDVPERGQRMVGKDVPERGQRMVGKDVRGIRGPRGWVQRGSRTPLNVFPEIKKEFQNQRTEGEKKFGGIKGDLNKENRLLRMRQLNKERIKRPLNPRIFSKSRRAGYSSQAMRGRGFRGSRGNANSFSEKRKNSRNNYVFRGKRLGGHCQFPLRRGESIRGSTLGRYNLLRRSRGDRFLNRMRRGFRGQRQ